jgi:nitrate reductase assembly molybdenum cofactor insertion protein NarJ
MNVTVEARAQDLLAHAAAWRLASLLLERPRAEWKGEIAELRAEVNDRALSSCAKAAEKGTEESYHRVFGPGGTVSPREVSYCGFEDPGHLMAKLQSFYHAFSFKPRREESVDHISVEAGFVGYLFLKEAYAQMQGDAEAAEITGSARERFINEHVSRCAQGMVEKPGDIPAYLRIVLLWFVQKG